MDINTLVNVTSRAWSMTVLALMQDGVPGRQAALLSASGAGRTALVQSLDHLIELGLVERNPGHGHPLRPEYRITQKGAAFGQTAQAIASAAPQAPPLLRRAWTLPILAVSRQPRHFSDIKAELGTITDRALSQSLQGLQKQHWISREIDTAAYPPRPLYRAANAGVTISEALNLAR
jgi:DNA-binding HxlR family transcriptional regulator